MDKKILNKFIAILTDTVEGDWILIGGSVLPLLDASTRATQDIDIVAPEEARHRDTLTLMQIAEKLSLPIEAINQAAGFFLYRIPQWKKNLVLLHEGKKARLFRPNATLYIWLKLNRLSESDLDDCERMLLYAEQHNEIINRLKLSKLIKGQLKQNHDNPRKKRLQKLLSLIT